MITLNSIALGPHFALSKDMFWPLLVSPFFLQGFFAKMERSMLAADAEKVVAKGEMSDEEKEVARREAQAHAAHPDEEVVEDAIWRNVALDFMEDELELLRK